MPLMRSLKVMRVSAGPGHIVFIDPKGTWVPDAVVEAAEAVGCIIVDEESVPEPEPESPKPATRRRKVPEKEVGLVVKATGTVT